MEHTLVIRWPDGRVERISLTGPVTRIGRSPDNDVVVPAEFDTISDHHIEIRASEGTYTIVDLADTGSVQLDDTCVCGESELRPDQEIRIGSTQAGQLIRLVIKTSAIPPTVKLSVDGMRETIPFAVGHRPESAYISTRWPSGEEVIFLLEHEIACVGRSPDVDLVVPQSLPYVSGCHFELHRTLEGFALVDLGSTNGTKINNRLVEPGVLTPLGDNDIIRIGAERLGASIGFTFHNPVDLRAPIGGYTTVRDVTSLMQIESIKIGRDPTCDIVLDSPNVARVHAVVRYFGEGNHYIGALDETVGVLVNNQHVKHAELKPGDIVQIGSHLLAYDGQTLSRFDSQGYRLDVLDLYKEVKTPVGPLRILEDISMTIMPREFVALVGGSGAGKSTLLDALNGFRPAEGQVILNGRNLYEHYEDFRTQLGYVPQHDILPLSLCVEDALDFTARLRLPPDVTSEERRERITHALETVDMNTEKIRKTRISKLSGGQRKRVSIASELLADPKLFFLDEPTSGLDPGLEKKMMYTLRSMADEGRTIVLITHATSNIVQVDHVAFLSQGKLVFFGPPQTAKEHFEVGDFADIYAKTEGHGVEWRHTFVAEKPETYQRYIEGRKRPEIPAEPPAGEQAAPRFSLGQSLRQFWVLSQRMFKLTLNDPISLFVALLVMPVVAIFFLVSAKQYIMVGDPTIVADPVIAAQTMQDNYLPTAEITSFLFGSASLALLVGAFGGASQLLQERSIYLRERMVNLGLPPYLGSKFFVFGGFALLQNALYLLVYSLGVKFPPEGVLLPGYIEIYITMFITTMVGVAIGLFISSFARSMEMALYMVLIVLFYQYSFSGTLNDLRGKPIESLSYTAPVRWTSIALGTTIDMNLLADSTIICGNKLELAVGNVTLDPMQGSVNIDDIRDVLDPSTLNAETIEFRQTGDLACGNRPVDPDEFFLPYSNSASDLIKAWLILLGIGTVFMLGTIIMLKRLDYGERRLA